MFKSKTAWFSDSVKRDTARFWVSQGGVISDWKTADYLFSDDASCPDTKSFIEEPDMVGNLLYQVIYTFHTGDFEGDRIHKSDEYVMDRATVFHSAYVSTCRLRQSTKSVPLGHYILPPVSVQREVKARIGRFIWEQDEMLGVTMPHRNRSTEQMLNVQTDAEGSQLEKGKKRQETCTNTSRSRDDSVCCEGRLYPVNNMVSDYVHIDQLKKFSGELHDFLPFHSGYSVSRSHRRRLPYQYEEKKTF